MEDYVNKNTLIQDEISKLFISSIICTLCNNILIDPVMCMKCQKVYCKKCIDKWSEKNEKCPEGCDSPDFKNSLAKNDILSKLKFKCCKCEQGILYYDAEKHHNLCQGIKSTETNKVTKAGITLDISKVKKLTPEEADKLVKEGNEMVYITGK